MPNRTAVLAAAVLAATATVLAPVFSPQAARAAATVTNPGFEAGSGQSPAGWSESATTSASFVESGGRSGSFRLSHWASAAYRVETTQTLTGLTAGPYTLRVWVKSGGGQNAAFVALRNCGGAEQRTALPVTGGTTWAQVSASTTVSTGSCTIVLSSDAQAGNWANFDDVEFAATGAGGSTIQIRGGDVSSLPKNEAFGATYLTTSGQRQDPLAILRAGGMNYARLKVWVNPADGYNNKARVLAMAQRIKAQGMRLLVDFHYSDSWADPGKQVKPAAWANLSFTALRQAVYDHTFDVCNALRAQGTTADMVQVGNEINPGMLLPTGSTSNWSNLAQLLTAGSNAVKAVSSSTRVMLHLAEGGDNALFRSWFDQATARGVPFDVIGASYYPYWHGSLASLQSNLNDVAARYNRDVVVVETAYGFTLAADDAEPNIFNSSLAQAGGFPATPQGQVDELRAVFGVVRNVPNGRGLGVFYWEPTWTAVTGSGWDPTNPNSGNGWENQALFDYNNRALPGVSVFGTV